MRERNAKGVYERVRPEDRFWGKVDKRGPEDCWPWLGPMRRNGYGYTTDFWKKILAHRFAYELTYGPIPESSDVRIVVMHSCDARGCVNPRHLWLGTQRANVADMMAKGRNGKGGKSRPGEANPRHTLTEPQVREIRQRYRTEAVTLDQLASEYSMSPTGIHAVIQRRTWKHVD